MKYDSLGGLVLLTDRLLGVLSGVQVHLVEVFYAWHQICQHVARHLCQGFRLGADQTNVSMNQICISTNIYDRTTIQPIRGKK